MRKMREPWSLILVALLLLLAANASESFQLFPRSHVCILNNSTQALLVRCEDKGGYDNFREEDYRVLKPGGDDGFDFDWLVAFFFNFDITCSISVQGSDKKCDVTVYNTETDYYDCLGDGCGWLLSDKHISYYSRIQDIKAGFPPSRSFLWC